MLKKMTKKIKQLLFLVLVLPILAGNSVVAQDCGIDLITSGNVQGYATSSNMGIIYLNTESWNDNNQSHHGR